MGEVSGNRSILVVIIMLIICLALGVTTIQTISKLEIEPVNKTMLISTVISSVILLALYVRVYFIQNAYYRERFATEDLGDGKTKVKYLQSTSINPFLLIVMLFKPMRAVTIGSFIVDVGKGKTIEGRLTAKDGRFSIGQYHLKETYELYEYLGDNIVIRVRGNRQEIIEKNLVTYKIQEVKRVG